MSWSPVQKWKNVFFCFRKLVPTLGQIRARPMPHWNEFWWHAANHCTATAVQCRGHALLMVELRNASRVHQKHSCQTSPPLGGTAWGRVCQKGNATPEEVMNFLLWFLHEMSNKGESAVFIHHILSILGLDVVHDGSPTRNRQCKCLNKFYDKFPPENICYFKYCPPGFNVNEKGRCELEN